MKRFLLDFFGLYTKIRETYFRDFVFIHINKTGGSSVRTALNLPHEHHTVQEKIRFMGRNRWDEKFSFAFVRNPYDKMVSQYHYRVQRDKEDIGFKDWLIRTYVEADMHHPTRGRARLYLPQLTWLADSSGEIAVSFIGRFENLQEDFAIVCARIRREGVTLPHKKKSEREPYYTYYDEESRAIVVERFAPDFDAFGYTFETQPR